MAAPSSGPEESLMTSDRAWILVGLLLRHGSSSSPSLLSLRSPPLAFTPSEIQWLCSLPFSPLSLSRNGDVTFSPFLFDLFHAAKHRYAPPSSPFVFQDRSFSGPLPREMPLSLPTLLCFSPSSRLSETQEDVPESHLITYGFNKDSNLSANPLVKHFPQKRCIQETPLSPRKKANVSITTNSHPSGTEDLSEKRCSNATDVEVEDSNASSLSLAAEKDYKIPTKLERKQYRHTNKQCYAAESSTAASLVNIKIELDPYVSMVAMTSNQTITINKRCNFEKSLLPDCMDDKSILHGSVITEMPNDVDLNVAQTTMHTSSVETVMNTSMLVADVNLSGNQVCTDGSVNALKESIDHSMNQKRQMEIGLENLDVDATATISPQNMKEAKVRSKVTKLPKKPENVKQASKLGKRKKASGHPRSQETGLACSPVMETCSSQPVDDKLPSFEGFIVESVEGSGGYGTVYKAMSKIDGKLRAIKYPYEKTSSKYVQNEIKVLQKYGGHNYIPRCVGVIEESGRQCLVLEYVEHEKPEILKKEITISELQTYGFSLFKALDYLHSKGVIHRDVKPGNFLFSRERRNGWLVDFNLATVQQKQVSSGGMKYQKKTTEGAADTYKYVHKAQQETESTSNHVVREYRSMPKYCSRSKTVHRETGHFQDKTSTPCSTPTCETNLSSRLTQSNISESHNYIDLTPNRQWNKSHFPEVSLDSSGHVFPKISSMRSSPASGQNSLVKGATSVLKGAKPNMQWSPLRQQQSGDTQNCEQMIPRFGRRELWEFVQKNQQSPQPPVSALPSSYKKRVAAPQKRKHQKVLVDQGSLQSTMPISRLSYVKTPDLGHPSKARVIPKMRKEGPCAGTKGYRAPEVLLKSPFQNEKIDIWSAGVSLFQLILGKSPFSFSSNLDQSLLDISQFSGSDAICTLAKEHNREATLPKEVSSSKLQPCSVQNWCEKNIKRLDILPLVPPSLFNLLERCLQIDPRNRISAKEALQHEFFTSFQKTCS